MIQQLITKIQKTKAPICVGLDPMLSYIPEHIVKKALSEYGETMKGAAEAIWQFNKEIVDHTYDLIPAVKPQIAMYTEFATVNPYFGTDGVKPFVDVCNQDDKGIFVLVKTSNPSSGEFQDQLVNGKPVYELVAEKVMEWGAMSMDGEYSNVGAVVGATYPEMSRILRKLMPHTYFLVPGYGAQGGTAEELKYCFNED